jgi:hypothetical protein
MTPAVHLTLTINFRNILYSLLCTCEIILRLIERRCVVAARAGTRERSTRTSFPRERESTCLKRRLVRYLVVTETVARNALRNAWQTNAR